MGMLCMKCNYISKCHKKNRQFSVIIRFFIIEFFAASICIFSPLFGFKKFSVCPRQAFWRLGKQQQWRRIGLFRRTILPLKYRLFPYDVLLQAAKNLFSIFSYFYLLFLSAYLVFSSCFSYSEFHCAPHFSFCSNIYNEKNI